MCAHVVMQCRQQSQYAVSHSTVSSGGERPPVFFSFSQFGTRVPYPEPHRFPYPEYYSDSVHQSSGNAFEPLKKRSTFVTVPISPEGSEYSVCMNSPSSVSSGSLKFYSPASSFGQSQSSLIMPSLLTIFKQGSQTNPRDTEESWNKNTSCKSLASLTKEAIDFPQPLIRKCNTSVSLSSSAIPVHSVVKNNSKEKLTTNFAPQRPNKLLEFYTVKRSLNRKKSVWTKPNDSTVGSLQENVGLTSCSRCTSNISLNRFPKDSLTGDESLFCKMCLGDFSIDNMYQLQQCQCRFCTYCMKMYVMLKIQDGECHIQCPDSNCDCNGEFTLEDVENLQSEKYIQLFLKHRAEAEIDLDPSRVWCPTPGCETVVQLSGSITTARENPICCPSCKLNFCANCSTRWVGTHLCHTYTKKLKDFIKRCPRCDIPIERDAGCAQMQCKKCKHVFCWYCLTSLEDDFLLRHYDKGSCKNKLGHSRASVLWHRAQVITIFTTVGLIMIAGFPLLLFLGPCLLCRKCCINCLSTERKEYYYNV